MSYRVSGLDRPVTFEAGASLLVTGPSVASESRLVETLAGDSPGEATVVITTNRPAGWVTSRFHEHAPESTASLGIVDATGQDSTVAEEILVEHVGSPGDLTGISLEFAKLARRFEQAGAGGRIRVGLASVSTLLMYAEIQTVFRFLHVFTSRIQSTGLFGVFALDPGMHDDQTVNTVRAVFDAEARIDDGAVTLTGTGFSEE